MQTQMPEMATVRSVNCPADCGVKVHIDYVDRMVWIDAEKSRFTVAAGLDDLVDAGYNAKSRTLGMALQSSLSYVEIPCSRVQAENILAHMGWDVSQMPIQPA